MGYAALRKVKEIGGWKAYGETMVDEYRRIIVNHVR
jgi:hypothetical protein